MFHFPEPFPYSSISIVTLSQHFPIKPLTLKSRHKTRSQTKTKSKLKAALCNFKPVEGTDPSTDFVCGYSSGAIFTDVNCYQDYPSGKFRRKKNMSSEICTNTTLLGSSVVAYFCSLYFRKECHSCNLLLKSSSRDRKVTGGFCSAEGTHQILILRIFIFGLKVTQCPFNPGQNND